MAGLLPGGQDVAGLTRPPSMRLRTEILAAALFLGPALADLPPVPVPAENPITEEKRVLGKMLFWDEQLSSDNTVACGTCHLPAAGGIDPRAGTHPGTDHGSIDDVKGSPGIRSLDREGHRRTHPVFGDAAQVTPRLSQPFFAALWAAEAFWDGRAGSEFRDPLSDEVAIATGGALENQALTALANDAEMAREARTWADLARKLERVRPLALATDWPEDVAKAIERSPEYPALFAAAFGDPAITPVRIGFAIATYERTLVADETPWDRYQAGDESALSAGEIFGWKAMQDSNCTNCHEPPLFTNNDFFNIGLRRSEFDLGRQAVTGDPEDAGEFKVPSLRNAALRPRFMHTGEFASLGAAIGFYRTGTALPDRDDIPGGGIYAFNMSALTQADILTFIAGALTDPRVAEETFPFDRPVLRTERAREDEPHPATPVKFMAEARNDGLRLSWQAPPVSPQPVDYVLERNGRVIALLTTRQFDDAALEPGETRSYALRARNAATDESAAAVLNASY